MIGCIVIAGIISICSIFAFFGTVVPANNGRIVPKMFDLMFGDFSSNGGYGTYGTWYRIQGLTFLFVIQILIIIGVLVNLYLCYRVKEKRDFTMLIGLTVVIIVASVVACIMSFCTIRMGNINKDGSYDFTLGPGPIAYSVMQIIAVLFYFIGLCLYNNQNSQEQTTPDLQRLVKEEEPKPNNPPKRELTENEKADLLIKYKKLLDEGAITQEEFDKKKNEIL